MPRIELIDVPLWQSNDPYHWEYDNLPLKNLMRRQNLINLSLDRVLEQLRDAIGTQGTVANRLNQSISPDGSLKSTAIDQAMHDIGSHVDSDHYVRMTKDQSDKLDLLADGATNVAVDIVIDEETTVPFTEGTLVLTPSESVEFSFETPNILKFHLTFPPDAAHRHFYGLTPAPEEILDPDYINFKVNSSASPFVEDSLRVYINGMRVGGTEVYVPGALPTDPWTLLSVTPDHENGRFALSSAISENDVIRIDFDIALVTV